MTLLGLDVDGDVAAAVGVVVVVGSKTGRGVGLSGLSNFDEVVVVMGLGLSNGSSLSFRLGPLGVSTRRGGRRIVLVFMATYPHATSPPNPGKEVFSNLKLEKIERKFFKENKMPAVIFYCVNEGMWGRKRR